MSRIALGCGNFGGIGSAPELFGQGESREEAFALMDAAWAAGINVFDTAASYGGGRSESWVGAWRSEREAPVLLSTKVYWSVTGDPDDRGLGRERILRELDGSLGRLGTERVDLYLTHEPDEDTPIEETLRALDEIVRAGKAGAIGASNLDGAGLEEALETSTRLGLARYGWVQNEYSLLRREAETEILPICAREGLGFTPFSPLAGGWLTGKYRRGEAYPSGSRMTLRPDPYADLVNEETFDGLEAFAAAAADLGVEPATLAVAWVLGNPQVTAVVVGPRRPEQLATAVAATELELSAGATRRAGRVVRVSELLVLGHDDVKRLLPMGECVELMETVLADLARGSVWQPLRFVVRPPEEPSLMGLMPAHRSEPTPSYGLKVICIFPSNAERGLDLHQGGVLLFDGETGALRALLDASAVTATRTAAVSAVATRLLARKDARRLAILGSGVQARSHLEAMAVAASLRGGARLEPDSGARERVRRRGAGAVPGRGGRDRGGGAAQSRRRRDRDVRSRADRPARVAGAGSARQRRRLVHSDGPRARRRHRRGSGAVRGRARVDGERGRRLPVRGARGGHRPRPHPRGARRGADRRSRRAAARTTS